MRAETQGHIEKIRKSLELLGQRMGLETAQHRLEEFNARVEDPDLWNDPERAQKLMRERQLLVDQIGTYEAIRSGLNDNSELIELGEAEGDAEVVAEAEAALKADLVEMAAAKELEALLDGEADANDTFLEINAGAGGTESCDWAGMLARMYTRWAEKRGYEVELQSVSYGRRGGDQVRRLQDLGPQRLWLAEIGIGRASAGADLAPMTARRGGTPRFRRSGSTLWWTTISRSR
jgi:peptide chain release factor 2